MLLTVLIPTIGRPTLARAMQSVASQTVPTACVVEHDPERTGCGPTLNRALPKVATPWVATMGDDDALHPQYAELLASLDHSSVDLFVFRMEYPDGSRLPLATTAADLRFGQVGCSYAVRTDLVRELGGWIDEPCSPVLAEDWELIQAARRAGARIEVVHRVVYYVRHNPFEEA